MVMSALIKKIRNIETDAGMNELLEKQAESIQQASNVIVEMIEVVVDPSMWCKDIIKTVVMMLGDTRLRSSEIGGQTMMNV